MGIEIAIRFKIEMLARRVFKQDGELWEPEEIKKHWQEDALKYAMTKEPFEVSVVIDNKHLPYGYDEAAAYEPLFVSGFIEPQLSKVQVCHHHPDVSKTLHFAFQLYRWFCQC